MRNRAVSVLTVALASAVALALYFALTFANIRYLGSVDEGHTADAIVVMGAAQYDGRPSRLLEQRLDTALGLWSDEKRAPLIALTGGKQEGDRFTEADAGQAWLVQRGVPQPAILMETVGRSTWESLESLAPVLRGAGVRSVIVVSSDWHVARAASSLQDLGFSATTVSIDGSNGGRSTREWLRETVGVGVGRLIGFDRLFRITG